MGQLRTGNLNGVFHPWLDVVSTSSPRTYVPPTEETTPEAYAQWGDESSFSYASDFPGFEVTNKGKAERDRYSYSEEGRKYHDYKVTNKDDETQYVIVRRVQQIAFSGPGGAQFNLFLANDTDGTSEGSGQVPTSPELDKL